MADEARQLRDYVEYFRDLGVHDFYRRGEPGAVTWPEAEGGCGCECSSCDAGESAPKIASALIPDRLVSGFQVQRFQIK